MSEYGKDLTLAIGDGGGPENFTVLASMQSNELAQANEAIGASNQGSAQNGHADFLAGVLRETAFSGNGLVLKAEAQQLQTAYDLPPTSTQNWQVTVKGVGTYTGPFSITGLNWTGPHDEAETFTLEMQALSKPTYTAET